MFACSNLQGQLAVLAANPVMRQWCTDRQHLQMLSEQEQAMTVCVQRLHRVGYTLHETVPGFLRQNPWKRNEKKKGSGLIKKNVACVLIRTQADCDDWDFFVFVVLTSALHVIDALWSTFQKFGCWALFCSNSSKEVFSCYILYTFFIIPPVTLGPPPLDLSFWSFLTFCTMV